MARDVSDVDESCSESCSLQSSECLDGVEESRRRRAAKAEAAHAARLKAVKAAFDRAVAHVNASASTSSQRWRTSRRMCWAVPEKMGSVLTGCGASTTTGGVAGLKGSGGAGGKGGTAATVRGVIGLKGGGAAGGKGVTARRLAGLKGPIVKCGFKGGGVFFFSEGSSAGGKDAQ